MMDNYERTLELVDIANNSAGQSQLQHAKTLDGIEAKLNQLTSTFQEFYTKAINSDLFKGFIGALNETLKLINKLPGSLSVVAVLLAVVFAKPLTLGVLDGIKDGWKAARVGANKDAFKAGAANQKAYNAGKDSIAWEDFFEMSQDDILGGVAGGSGGLRGNVSRKVGGWFSGMASSGVVQGLTSAFTSALPMIGVVTFATTLASTIKDKIDESLQKSVEEAQMKATESSSAYRSLSTDAERLRELSNKQIKTNEEKEEFLTLQENIAKQYPELISAYDAEGKAVIDLGKQLDVLIEKKNKAAIQDELKATQREIEQLQVERGQKSAAGITTDEFAYTGKTQKEIEDIISGTRTSEQQAEIDKLSNEIGTKLREGLSASFDLALSGLEVSDSQKTFITNFKKSLIEIMMLNPTDATKFLDVDAFSDKIYELTSAASYATEEQMTRFNELISNIDNLTGEEISNAAKGLKEEFSKDENTKFLAAFIDENIAAASEKKTEIQNEYARLLLPDSASEQQIQKKGKELGRKYSLAYMEGITSAFDNAASLENFMNVLGGYSPETQNQAVSALSTYDFSQSSDIADYRKELIQLGIVSSDVEQIIGSFPTALERSGFTLRGTMTDIDEYNKKLSDMTEISRKAAEGTLTMDEVLDLMSNDATLTVENFRLTSEGYALTGRSVASLTNSYRENTQAIYANRIELAEQELATLRAALANEKDASKQAELTAKIKETEDSIKMLTMAYNYMPTLDIKTDVFQAFLDTTSQMESGVNAITDALNDMSDAGQLSFDTIQALIDMGPEYAAAIDVQNGAIVANIGALQDLNAQRQVNYQAMLDAAIGEVEAQIATVDAGIAAADALIQGDLSKSQAAQAYSQVAAAVAVDVNKSNIGMAQSATQLADGSASGAEGAAQNLSQVSLKAVQVAESVKQSMKSVFNSLQFDFGTSAGSAVGGNISTVRSRALKIGQQSNANMTSSGMHDSMYAMNLLYQSGLNTNEVMSALSSGVTDWNEYAIGSGITGGQYAAQFESIKAGLQQTRNDLQSKLDLLKKLKEVDINKMISTGGKGTSGSGGSGGGGGGSTADAAKELEEYITKLEKFYNMMQKISALERRKDILESQRELIDNIDELSENVSEAYRVSDELQNAYKEMVSLQTQEQKDLQGQLEKQFSGYVTFEKGYLEIYYDKITTLDKERGEALEKLIDKYEEATDAVQEYTDNVRDEIKYQKELVRTQQENVVTLEQRLVDNLIAEDERRIEAVKKKYDAIKEEDSKYLESIRKNLNEQRALRDKENAYSDLQDKEKRLALLQRDTSGVYQKEILQLQQEIADQRQNLSDQEIDDTLSKLEERLNAQATAYDKEVEYLENSHQLKLDSMTEYWAEVDKIVSGGYDNIMSFLKKYDEEFIKGSKTAQEMWLSDWEDNTRKALAAMKALDANFGNKGNGSSGGGSSKPSGGGSGGSSSGGGGGSAPKTISMGSRVRSTGTGNADSYGTGGGARTGNTGYIDRIEPGRPYPYRMSSAKSGGTWLGWYKEKDLVAFKRGGLVDYTGPAWVDGTKSNPESFLNAADTKNISALKDALSQLLKGSKLNYNPGNSQKAVGDVIKVYVNVDGIDSDYGVENALDKVKKELIKATGHRNVTMVQRTR